MLAKTRWIGALPALALTVFLFGCDEQKEATNTPGVKSAPPATTTALPSATMSATPPKETVAKPSHACPDGSEGEGTFKNPCVATGTKRMMEVTWTGKITDEGPQFRVINNAKLEVLYGQLVVYFYDKAGKQLQVPADDSGGEAHTKQKCSGNIFAGPMKAGEKAVLWFSCVKKKHVPEGTVAIEGEMKMVGFTGDDGKKADTYWRNDALTPDERPKGGEKK